MAISYDGKLFRPVANSPNGQVNHATIFRYGQNGNLLTSTYAGGGIQAGQMLGLVHADGSLEFCYHHLTDGGELGSGKCRSRPEYLEDGRIRLHENWRWTTGDLSEGTSVIEEITD